MTETAAHTANIIRGLFVGMIVISLPLPFFNLLSLSPLLFFLAYFFTEMHLISPFSSSSLSLFLSSTAKQWSVSSTTRLISLVFSSLTPSSTNEEETIEESGEERKLKVLGESLGMCMRQRYAKKKNVVIAVIILF